MLAVFMILTATILAVIIIIRCLLPGKHSAVCSQGASHVFVGMEHLSPGPAVSLHVGGQH